MFEGRLQTQWRTLQQQFGVFQQQLAGVHAFIRKLAQDVERITREDDAGRREVELWHPGWDGALRMARPSGPGGRECGMVPMESSYRGVGQQWNEFVGMLSNFVGRSIVDRTGLSGQVDINLAWKSPDSGPAQAIDSGPALADLKAPPNLLVAVEEQLGLKLEPTTAPAEVLVIDSVDRPTPN